MLSLNFTNLGPDLCAEERTDLVCAKVGRNLGTYFTHLPLVCTFRCSSVCAMYIDDMTFVTKLSRGYQRNVLTFHWSANARPVFIQRGVTHDWDIAVSSQRLIILHELINIKRQLGTWEDNHLGNIDYSPIFPLWCLVCLQCFLISVFASRCSIPINLVYSGG